MDEEIKSRIEVAIAEAQRKGNYIDARDLRKLLKALFEPRSIVKIVGI